MTTSKFCIVPLPTEVTETARRSAANGESDHAIMVADSPNGYPCRHCLRFARSGERVILFPYAAIPPDHPYSESGPIFVHAEPCQRYTTTREFPEELREGRERQACNAEFDVLEVEIETWTERDEVIDK